MPTDKAWFRRFEAASTDEQRDMLRQRESEESVEVVLAERGGLAAALDRSQAPGRRRVVDSFRVVTTNGSRPGHNDLRTDPGSGATKADEQSSDDRLAEDRAAVEQWIARASRTEPPIDLDNL